MWREKSKEFRRISRNVERFGPKLPIIDTIHHDKLLLGVREEVTACSVCA